MRKASIYKRIAWFFGGSVVLLISWLLCNYVFDDVLSIGAMPSILLIIGGVVLLFASLRFSRKVICCAAVGYILSFIVAVIFDYEYYAIYYIDGVETAMRETSGLAIWTITYLGLIGAGILWDIIHRCVNRWRRKSVHDD